MLAKRLGHEIKYPSDCERLSIDIENSVHQHIGVTTLKRIMGFVGGVTKPRMSTLDILAQYVSFDSYQALISSINPDGNRPTPEELQFINTQEIPQGGKITVCWHDGMLSLRRLAGNQDFAVVKSSSPLLRPDDIIVVSGIHKGYPLYISSITRGNISSAGVTIADISGIVSIRVE